MIARIDDTKITSMATKPGYEKNPSVIRKYTAVIIMVGYGSKIHERANLLNYFQLVTE